jgi:hypothetical protein
MGDSFESLIGCLIKYQAWATEADDTVAVRHATLREDKPSKRELGGSGHEFAYDVLVSGDGGKESLQCKYGPGAHEFTAKYEQSDNYSDKQSKMRFVTETGDDGTFNSPEKIATAFDAIANSNKSANATTCDALVERYNLDRYVKQATGDIQTQLGTKALLSVR